MNGPAPAACCFSLLMFASVSASFGTMVLIALPMRLRKYA